MGAAAADRTMIRSARKQQQDEPQRTGFPAPTERYCHRSGRERPLRNPAPPAFWPLRGFGGGGANRRRNRMEDSVKRSDTQRRLLAAASQRDDGALNRPPRLTAAAAGKVVATLLAE